MAILHDLTPMGRLLAVLEMCEMHAARGDMHHMPGLVALMDQTRRLLNEEVRARINTKQISVHIPVNSKDELPI